MTKHGSIRACALGASLVVVVASCVAVEPAPSATIGAGPSDAAGAIAEFVRLADDARADAGCRAPLTWHDGVASVAQAHSDDMQRNDYYDHIDRAGRTPMERIQAAGIRVRAVAENIAQGQPTGAVVFRGWMDSPGHRRNLLNCEYTHHGVGLAGRYWTHVLVRLR
ncbi:MAG TPA: CAP domain-containing protein [Longimicrobiales bacterium]